MDVKFLTSLNSIEDPKAFVLLTYQKLPMIIQITETLCNRKQNNKNKLKEVKLKDAVDVLEEAIGKWLSTKKLVV